MNNKSCLALVLCLALLGYATTTKAVESYTENFSTTTYMDTPTTADWNTIDGELKLFPFTSTVEGNYNSLGVARGVAISGNLAFMADGYSGMHIIDITNPDSPVLVQTVNTSGYAYDVQVMGDYAFVADWESGVQVIDVSTPASPFLAGTYNTFGVALSLEVDNDMIYVGDGGGGFLLLDITNPPSPSFVGSLGGVIDATRGLDVARNIVYLTDGANGLRILDITNPFSPVLLNTFSTAGTAYDVSVSGNYAYVSVQGTGLQIVDITNPAAPFLAGTLPVGSTVYGLTVSGSLVYLANHTTGLQVIDVSDPTLPVLHETINTPNTAYDVEVVGEYAFVGDGGGGLQTIKTSQTIPQYYLDAIALGGQSHSLEVSGSYAYVAASANGMVVLDLTNPSSMSFVAAYDPGSDVLDVAIAGDYAYLANSANGLVIVDISDPTMPVYVGDLPTSEQANGVSVSGRHAYLASMSGGLEIINILNPVSPVLVGTYSTMNNAENVVTDGDYAYVSTGTATMEIIDISNTALPLPAGSYTVPSGTVENVFIDGDIAYVAGGNAGLVLVDISDPSLPTLIDIVDTPTFAEDVIVSGDRAYVADIWGIEQVDVSSPFFSFLVPTSSVTFGTHDGLALSGDKVYVASENAAVYSYQVTQREVDIQENKGVSIAFDNGTDTIVRARLTGEYQGDVSYELMSANSTWQTILPDNQWNLLDNPGSSLGWQTTHGFTPGTLSEVTKIQVSWLNEFASIESITDIANDQGRQVSLEWGRSGHDFMDSPTQVVEYAVYREIDSGLSKRIVQTQITDMSGASDAVCDNAEIMLAAGWHYLTSVPVLLEESYAVVVPTLADSTISEGQYFSSFKVVALTATPGVFFTSPADSGYSIDNLAPGVPMAITAGYQASSVTLDWDDAPETDFQFFRVYRDTNPGFVPSAGNLAMEVASSDWIDTSVDPWNNHYKITAVDFNGNESDAGVVDVVSGVQGPNTVPIYSLGDAVPNPFNPATEISYTIPVTGTVQLTIYDLAGREVRRLVDESQDSGSHSVQWNGLSHYGSRAPSGVYLYQLRSGSHVERKRMTLLK